ncbi:MAG: hypothetical protein ACYDHH_02430 [Solirubrobacteraceae bacterium]
MILADVRAPGDEPDFLAVVLTDETANANEHPTKGSSALGVLLLASRLRRRLALAAGNREPATRLGGGPGRWLGFVASAGQQIDGVRI